MSRYIDANELLKAMDTWDKFGFSHSGAFVREPENDDYVPYVHYDDMVKCVKGMSITDVVEVVRCKDCWKRGDEDFCPLVSDSCYPPALPDDWFCKDGERREE